jgi:lysophospholipase L1-like esterase
LRSRLAAVAVAFTAMTLTSCGGSFHANSNIVFVGDSIIYYWVLPAVNRGVPGDTTTAIAARFPSQVVGHGYKAVVLLGGSNDIRNPNLSVAEETAVVVSNLQTMASQATANKLVVVLCEIPPIEGQDNRVVTLNAAIAALATAHKYKYVDFYTPMASHPEYFKDGLHPSGEGYDVMENALARVLPLDY